MESMIQKNDCNSTRHRQNRTPLFMSRLSIANAIKLRVVVV
ncbi:hypothetical protein FVER14953_20334 [Fusarium verticillioides]|nr:hypothetical protein FVER14953_20334 [Fusarium verticillioides]